MLDHKGATRAQYGANAPVLKERNMLNHYN